MRSYNQYCPVARGASVFSDRWTPLLIREFSLGATRFNEIARGLPKLSRTLLSSRLAGLQQDGIVEQSSDDSYRLTEAGRALQPLVEELGKWAAEFLLTEPELNELDPELLCWWIHRNLRLAMVPRDNVLIRYSFSIAGQSTPDIWMRIRRDAVSLRRKKPVGHVDLTVVADLSAFYEVWLGRLSFKEATSSGRITLSGEALIVQIFPKLLKLSPYASVVRELMEKKKNL